MARSCPGDTRAHPDDGAADRAGHGRPHDDARANADPESYNSHLRLSAQLPQRSDQDPRRGDFRTGVAARAGGGGGEAARWPAAAAWVAVVAGRGGGTAGRAARRRRRPVRGRWIWRAVRPERKPPERYTVCVRYNAKDVDGRYPGIKKQGMAVYARGRFDRFVPQQHRWRHQAE